MKLFTLVLFCAAWKAIDGDSTFIRIKKWSLSTWQDLYFWSWPSNFSGYGIPQNNSESVNINSLNKETTPFPCLTCQLFLQKNPSFKKPVTPRAPTVTPRIATQNIQNVTTSVTTFESITKKPKRIFSETIKIDYDEMLKEIVESNATIAKMVYDVCSPYNPSVPDFRAPGKRVSEVKCSEYTWKLKYVADKNDRFYKCNRLKLKLTGDTRGFPTTIGGRITRPGEFPHMGAIAWKGVSGDWVFKCGSSLISPKFVLTAAHCTKAPINDKSLDDPVPKIVRLSHKNIVRGLPSKTKGEFDINIFKIIPHPNYESPKKYYDIALMELEIEVGFSQLVQPSCLWGRQDITKLGDIATLTGWGVLAEDSLDISPELQAAVLDIIDSNKCDGYLGGWCNSNWCGVEDHQLCAGKLSGGVDACQGDSGSPLQVKIPLEIDTFYNMYYVIGVTSFGVGCAQPNLPGVYSRVSSFIDWIEGVVWP